MAKQSEPGSAREAVDRLVEAGLLDEVMSNLGEGGVQLTGEGGFLPELVKRVLEAGLAAELTDHLGYERHDPAGHGSGNSRNGFTPKRLGTEVGDVELATPRDRNAPTIRSDSAWTTRVSLAPCTTISGVRMSSVV